MTLIIRILLALTLAVTSHAPAYADSVTLAADKTSGKPLPNQTRKLFGAYVQARMTEAFDGTLATVYPCGDRPAYYCQGLMVTAFENDSTYWMDPDTPKLSFTYFRRDIATALFANTGLVLWPQAYVDHAFPRLGQDAQPFKPVYRCAFPLDGDSDARTDTGCGQVVENGEPVAGTAPCASLGITTARQWIDKYRNAGPHICGFALDPSGTSDDKAKGGMDLTIETATLLKQGGPYLFPWNEIVMAPWPGNDPARIPLMAFFKIASGGARAPAPADKTSQNVYAEQLRYYSLTGIFVPIIEISAADGSAVFTYRDDDQAVGIPDTVTVFPR